MLLSLAFAAAAFVLGSTADDGPIVSTKFGRVQGFEVLRQDDGYAEVFLAIPYAKPPVGELRFEKPQPPEPWEDIYRATAFRNDCIPHAEFLAKYAPHVGEDCLTFNVIRPKQPKSLLPVLLWIHGGGYEVGAASHHGYQVFADKYAPKDVIVVSIQYRLGFLGFFTDGTKNAPGNMGLFDQAAALKFVHDNIEDFGGDKTQITIWGYSAGASSTSQLTLSPYTRDLYSKAIIMSASSFVGWATGRYIPDSCALFAKTLGCEGANAKDCLKKKSINEMLTVVKTIGESPQSSDILRFAPVLDNDFLPAHPYDLAANAPAKPTIIGLSSKEGNFFTVMNNGQFLQTFGLTKEMIEVMDERYVMDVLRKKVVFGNRFESKRDEVLEKINDYYLQRGKPAHSEGNGFVVDRYTEFLSDIFFNVAVVREIVRRVEINTPMWVYKFEYFNDEIFKDHVPREARGSPHANEYRYLFEMKLFNNLELDEKDKIVQEDIIEMVISFAKDGTPKVRNEDWPQVIQTSDIPYLNFGFGPKPTIEHGFFEDAYEFWESIGKLGFDVVDPASARGTRQQRSEL